VLFSPDGNHFGSAHNDSYLTIWQAREMKYGHFYSEAPMASVMAIAFSPDSKLLAAAFGDGKVYLYSPQSDSKPQLVLDGFTKEQPAMSVAFSPDGQTLAAGGEGGRLIIYRAAP
jgi:WD40 repeat protein